MWFPGTADGRLRLPAPFRLWISGQAKAVSISKRSLGLGCRPKGATHGPRQLTTSTAMLVRDNSAAQGTPAGGTSGRWSVRTMVSESRPDWTTSQPSDKYRPAAGLARSTLRLSVWIPRLRA